jgi:anti-sigma regulatory factor (Ser/Thr protein kinase)
MIPVITSARLLFDEVRQVLHDNLPENGCIQLEKASQAMEFLSIEMPELVVINFADSRIDADFLLNVIKSDSWLLNSGIIGICESPQIFRESELLRGTNIVALVDASRLGRQLARVFSIIFHNRHMLFQRIIGADLGNRLSASFKLQNDPLEAHVFINLICNYLFNINKIDAVQKEQLGFVLHELLINAIEHGNCGISFQEKTDWLGDGRDIIDLIDLKCADAAVASRKVFLEYSIHDEFTSFRIADEGAGFDWKSHQHNQTKQQQPLELHGRGIALSMSMTRNLVYEEKGNALQFDFLHKKAAANTMPALFHDLETIQMKAGDTVFEQGEPSNFLYYLAQGTFEMLISGNRVSMLTPDDIFLGEMSFLLNNRRSATVKAVTDGCLIRISKKEFVAGIKEKPHYSLFLARLLAQRIERLNQKLGHDNL